MLSASNVSKSNASAMKELFPAMMVNSMTAVNKPEIAFLEAKKTIKIR